MTSSRCVGQRSEIPQIRERTPSPIRAVQNMPAPPPLARDLNVFENVGKIDVVYAEDEEVFRETAIRELLKAGFDRSNIRESENGIGALEHLARLQGEGNLTLPLLVLLDVRMPGMDGRECALQIQELVKRRLLRREPFVICISSIHRQVEFEEGKGNFQVVLPKPFSTADVQRCIELLNNWWVLGHGRQLAAWKSFAAEEIDIIVADEEPVCRMSSYMAFAQVGVLEDSVHEVDDEEALLETLAEQQAHSPTRPLILLLGHSPWAMAVKTQVDGAKESGKREPFIVCTSVDSERVGASPAVRNFHAILPRAFTKADVKWCLELCRLWWLTRGDGPANDSDSGSESGHSSPPDSPRSG